MHVPAAVTPAALEKGKREKETKGREGKRKKRQDWCSLSVIAQDKHAEMLAWGSLYQISLSRGKGISFHFGFSMKHSRRQIDMKKGNRAKTTAPRVSEIHLSIWPRVGEAAGMGTGWCPHSGKGVRT